MEETTTEVQSTEQSQNDYGYESYTENNDSVKTYEENNVTYDASNENNNESHVEDDGHDLGILAAIANDYKIPTTDDGDFDYDNMTEEQKSQVLDALEGYLGNEKGENKAPVLPDKFKSVEDLVKSYQILESKMGNFVKAPERYEIEGIDIDNDPILQDLAAEAKQLNMSNEAFSRLVNKHIQAETQMEKMRMQQEFAKLGPDAKGRIDHINGWLNENLNPHQAKVLMESARDAETVQAIEALIQAAKPSIRSGPTIQQARPVAYQSPHELLYAKDQFGNLRMESDPEYAAMVNKRLANM